MDISNSTIEQLEAMAYREVVTASQAQKNLQILEQRIADLKKADNHGQKK